MTIQVGSLSKGAFFLGTGIRFISVKSFSLKNSFPVASGQLYQGGEEVPQTLEISAWGDR